MTPEANTMATLLADLGSVATKSLSMVGDIADCIVDTPLLLLTVGFLFIGGCIGIFGRMLSRG